jgi:hypothetical protein
MNRAILYAITTLSLASLACISTVRGANLDSHGILTDWSHRHVVFSRPASLGGAAHLMQDPRYAQQWVRRGLLDGRSNSERRSRLPFPIPSRRTGDIGSKRSRLEHSPRCDNKRRQCPMAEPGTPKSLAPGLARKSQLLGRLDYSGYKQQYPTCNSGGISKTGVHPNWSGAVGALTADNTVTWRNLGAVATANLSASGGAGGIVMDNVVGSGTLPGASQVYFSTLGTQVCGSSGFGGCAVQTSQPALQ